MARPSIPLAVALLAVAFLLALPALAWAAGDDPQPVAFHADTAIWTIVVFLLLLLVLTKVTLPGMPKPAFVMMQEGLKRREENIQSALDEARQAREEAQELRTQLKAEMDQAHDRVRELIDEARRDAEHVKEDMVAQARGEIQTERDRLHREVDIAKDQALQEIWNQTAQLATLVSSKTIRRQLSADDHRALVDEALAELKQAGPGGDNSLDLPVNA